MLTSNQQRTTSSSKNRYIRDVIKIPIHWVYALLIYFYCAILQTPSYFKRGRGESHHSPSLVSSSTPYQLTVSPSPPLHALPNVHQQSPITTPSVSTPLKTLMVFINPISGQRKSIKIFDSIRHLFESRGYTLIISETKYKNDAYRMTSQLSQKDCDGIVCVGGDGLINEVVNGLLNRDDQSITRHIPIGVIPTGINNGFATSMGITTIESAVSIILRAQINYIDVMAISPIYNHNRQHPYLYPLKNNNTNNQQLNGPNNNRSEDDSNYIDMGTTGGYYNENRSIYSIVSVGWGAISYREQVQHNIRFSKYFKPYVAMLYSLFLSLPLKQFDSTLYYQPCLNYIQSFHSANNNNNNNNSNDNNRVSEISIVGESDIVQLNNNNNNNNNTTQKIDQCSGCKSNNKSSGKQPRGKRSIHDIRDWQSLSGVTASNPKGLSFFIASNCSHLSQQFKMFPCSHVSDGFIDLAICTQTDKKQLLSWLFNDIPPLLNINNNNHNHQNNNNNNQAGIPNLELNNNSSNIDNSIDNESNNMTPPTLSTSLMSETGVGYCKTKEVIFQQRTMSVPLIVDGDTIEMGDRFGVGCDQIKIECKQMMCAFFL